MAYQVLARRWRPQRFGDMVGQEHVTRTLTNAIRSGRLAHAFLFCGPRGVGKTSAARILAKCLNCETAADGPVQDPCNECGACGEIGSGTSLDVLEIDGASNRGIDEIRDLRESVRYAPSAGRAKVYIIDEVHMLTKEAFNALLKTLEEPPDAVYFVFATTEANRVPATIRSRCQKYDFRRISPGLIVETLGKLAEKEKIEVEPDALAELARQADGGLRDAQSLLDQAAAVGEGKVTLEGLRSLLGEPGGEACLRIVERVLSRDAAAAFAELQELLERGLDPARVGMDLTGTLRDLLIVRQAPESAVSLGVPGDLVQRLTELAGSVSEPRLSALLALASGTAAELRGSPRPRLALEVALARMSALEDAAELAELAARLEELRGDSGPGASNPPGPRTPPASRPEPARPAAPAPAPSPPASPGEEAGSGGEGSLWPTLLARVRGRKVTLASFLEHGAPAPLDGDTLSATFDSTYYEGMVNRRENAAIIREELCGILGRSATFQARVEETSRPGPSVPQAGDVLQRNPGLKRVIEDLGGRMIPDTGSALGGDA